MAIKSKALHDLTLRSIKREIGAGRDVAFWLDKAYTHYDNGLLDVQHFRRGDKIAQLVILPIVTPALKLVDKFAETERGDNGFGSTGR